MERLSVNFENIDKLLEADYFELDLVDSISTVARCFKNRELSEHFTATFLWSAGHVLAQRVNPLCILSEIEDSDLYKEKILPFTAMWAAKIEANEVRYLMPWGKIDGKSERLIYPVDFSEYDSNRKDCKLSNENYEKAKPYYGLDEEEDPISSILFRSVFLVSLYDCRFGDIESFLLYQLHTSFKGDKQVMDNFLNETLAYKDKYKALLPKSVRKFIKEWIKSENSIPLKTDSKNVSIQLKTDSKNKEPQYISTLFTFYMLKCSGIIEGVVDKTVITKIICQLLQKEIDKTPKATNVYKDISQNRISDSAQIKRLNKLIEYLNSFGIKSSAIIELIQSDLNRLNK